MGERVSFDSNGDSCEGYLAVPASGHGPGVVVIREWWGLVGHITAVADRFADAGFVALAPDLYHGLVAREPDEAGKMLMGLAMDRAARDIAGAAHALAARDDVTGGIGTVGFCMGGSLALWSATFSPDIVAAVGFYPALPWDRLRPQWSGYQGKTAMIHTDEHEGGSRGAGVVAARTAIEAAGGRVEVFDYPGTGHAFFNDDRPEVYHSQAAALAWERTLDLLRRQLVA